MNTATLSLEVPGRVSSVDLLPGEIVSFYPNPVSLDQLRLATEEGVFDFAGKKQTAPNNPVNYYRIPVGTVVSITIG